MRVTVTIFKYIEPNDPSKVTWQLNQQHESGEIYNGSITCGIDDPTPPAFQQMLQREGWQKSGLDGWSMWRTVFDVKNPHSGKQNATAN